MANLIENSVSVTTCSQNPTDWEILNHLSIKRLRRLLSDSEVYTSADIEKSCELILAYHQVCRQSLIQLRYRKHYGRCPAATSEQLQQIVCLQQKNGRVNTSQQILTDLQKLARHLRQGQYS